MILPRQLSGSATSEVTTPSADPATERQIGLSPPLLAATAVERLAARLLEEEVAPHGAVLLAEADVCAVLLRTLVVLDVRVERDTLALLGVDDLDVADLLDLDGDRVGLGRRLPVAGPVLDGHVLEVVVDLDFELDRGLRRVGDVHLLLGRPLGLPAKLELVPVRVGVVEERVEQQTTALDHGHLVGCRDRRTVGRVVFGIGRGRGTGDEAGRDERGRDDG